ncbi:S-layer domain protein [Paenibacillus curdlanolyticus YK9]|uniref:S-layer domain protein n=1 Tax=Paenibacillus curdlanolyticus YK9 TaxID=717606 RepID=E0IFU7_9BACL|nr:S-layer homology domain-containing protein [Paenibacillus curdlanolyticus]EFM08658.1 S-layer domain protein [Paenibacillus curdlanolyticus YK9]
MKRIIMLMLAVTLVTGVSAFPMKGASAYAASTSSASELKDISKHWAKVSIEKLVAQGIVSGYEDGTYKPDKVVSREEFLSLVIRAKKYALADVTNQPFADVATGRWSAPFIQSALQANVIAQKDYGAKFQPAGIINRVEMAGMLAHALQLDDASNASFKDAASFASKKGMVAAVANAGLITGYPDGTFKPSGQLTRAEAAAVIVRLMDFKRDDKDYVTYSDKVNEQTESSPITGYLASDNKVTIGNAQAESIKAGQIILLAPSKTYPFGAAKRVESVSVNGNQTVLATTEPELEDVLRELDVTKDVPMTASQFEINPQYVGQGISYSLPSPKAEAGQPFGLSDRVKVNVSTDNGLKISFEDMEIDLDDQPIKLEGSMTMRDPVFHSDVKWGLFGLKRFNSSMSYTLENELTISVPVDGGEGSIKGGAAIVESNGAAGGAGVVAKAKRIGTHDQPHKLTLGKLTVPVYGPLGVVVEVHLVIEGDMTVGLTFKVEAEAVRTIGLEYTKPGFMLKDEVTNADVDSELTADAEIGLHAGAGVGILLGLFNYGLGGVEGEAGLAGEAGAHLNVTDPTQSCYDFKLETYAKANAVLDFPKFFFIDDITYTLAEKRWPIWEKSNCKPVENAGTQDKPSQEEDPSKTDSGAAKPDDGSSKTSPAGESKTVFVPAAGNPLKGNWTATGITAKQGGTLQIEAVGTGDYNAHNYYLTDPDGRQLDINTLEDIGVKMDGNAVFSSYPIGALVGVIRKADGTLSEPFMLGKHVTAQAPATGELLLAYNDAATVGDDGFLNNSGGYTVQVTIK